jgi:hypothetical protein
VVRQIFKACTVWIYTQSNITSISRAVMHNLAISFQTQQRDELTFVFLVREEGLLINVSIYRVSKKKRYGNSTGCCASQT